MLVTLAPKPAKFHVHFFRNTPHQSLYVINGISHSCLFIITFNELANQAEYDTRQGSRNIILVTRLPKVIINNHS